MSVASEVRANSLHFRASIDAPDELLWSYLSTASGLACWQADTVEGDLESGSFSLRWPELGARLDLSVADAERGRRLVLRAGGTSVTLGVQSGVVELLHEGLDEGDDFSGFESSWLTALALLKLAATRHPRVPRAVVWLFAPVPTTADHLHCYFTESAALSTWLGQTPQDFSAGAPYQIELFGGQSIGGEVLYCQRDVCLHVREWNHGALALRSLPGPEDGRVAALGISTWESRAPREMAPALEGALRRLSTATQSRE
jgi:uncharacterized protein YndB with AHSA1/START domain